MALGSARGPAMALGWERGPAAMALGWERGLITPIPRGQATALDWENEPSDGWRMSRNLLVEALGK